MDNKLLLENMLQNLNDDGLSVLADLFGNLDMKERYNKNTTPERLEELKQLVALEEKQMKIKREEERLQKLNEWEEQNHKENEERQKLVVGSKKFLEEIENVSIKNYELNSKQMQAIHAKDYWDTFDMMLDYYKAGFIKGQRAEKARMKARVC